MLSICGNSFKAVGKAFLMKLVERMSRVCRAVNKSKGGYFEESQISFDLLNTFSYYMIPYVLFNFVFISSPLFYNGKNKEKPLNE